VKLDHVKVVTNRQSRRLINKLKISKPKTYSKKEFFFKISKLIIFLKEGSKKQIREKIKEK